MSRLDHFYSRFCKKFFKAVLICGTMTLTGCSFEHVRGGNNANSNVAYAVPGKVAVNGVNTRRKPTRPLWTENRIEDVDEVTIEEVDRSEVYVVRKGDTLYRVARNMGMSVRDLMELNGLNNSSKLVPGQRLRLPGKVIRTDILLESPIEKNQKKVATYVVQRGDSLCKIAKRRSMTVTELKSLNDLVSDRIYAGQILKVYENPDFESTDQIVKKIEITSQSPTRSRQFVLDGDGYYAIQSGDTLDAVARGLHVNLEQLKILNGISDPRKLQVGKKLIIPNAQKDAVASKSDLPVARPIAGTGSKKQLPFSNDESIRNSDVQPSPVVRASDESVQAASSDADMSESEAPNVDNFFENFDEIPVVEISN